MIIRYLIALSAATFFLAAISGAQAAQATQEHVTYTQASKVTVALKVSRITSLRQQTWSCEQQAELPVTAAADTARALAAGSDGYRAWVARLWLHRLARCQRTLSTTLPATGDWQTAVHIVQRSFPGSEQWLLDCSGSEGSHGPFVYHGGAVATQYEIEHEVVKNTPGGWMQYFPGTFTTDFDAAVQYLHQRGVRVPPSAFSWYSPLGQAVAAGWAYGHDRPSGKWTGSNCA